MAEGVGIVGSLVGVHVLLVNSDSDALALVKHGLEYCGALVTACLSLDIALRVLARLRADVVVMDVAGTGDERFWPIRKLRGVPSDQGGGVPVIALTDLAAEGPRLMAEGFQAHFAKPVPISALCRTIAEMSGRQP